MKKFKTTIPVLILFFIPFLQSCMEEGTKEYSLAITTIKIIEGNTYYFTLDNGKKMWPGDTKAVYNYKPVDGQRAYVYFDYLEEKMEGYDSNIMVAAIANILTKEIIPMTAATTDSIGNDPVNISEVWFGGGYLNIQFTMMGTNNPSKLHMVNLVRNQTGGETAEEEEENYYSLEFRHNAYYDNPYEPLAGIASFKTSLNTHEMRGIKIRYNSIDGGIKYIKVNFDNSQIQAIVPRSSEAGETYK